jgi:hypothetical protein
VVCAQGALKAVDECLALMDTFSSTEDRYNLSAIFNDIFQVWLRPRLN